MRGQGVKGDPAPREKKNEENSKERQGQQPKKQSRVKEWERTDKEERGM